MPYLGTVSVFCDSAATPLRMGRSGSAYGHLVRPAFRACSHIASIRLGIGSPIGAWYLEMAPIGRFVTFSRLAFR